jgi:addiction module HigA family antidote
MSHGINWTAIDRAVGIAQAGPVHPGEVLTEWMDEHDMTQHELATRCGMTDPYVGMVRGGAKRVGPVTALRLERGTGIRAEVWLHLQMAHDLAQLRGGTA